MENSESQNYRDSLAMELRQEPDRDKRREILLSARSTEEYQDAKKLRRLEFTTRQENKAQNERLSQYANEHYQEYTAFDPETVELLNVIGTNRETFDKETLQNISDVLIDKAKGFLKGKRGEEIVALMKRANFDYERLLASEGDDLTKTYTLLEAILKAQSYGEAVAENEDKEIIFSGFENDPDIPDAKEYINRVFSAELLQKCLISNVKYAADMINVNINHIDYILPIDVYMEWEKQMSEVKNRKFRAESFIEWNTDPEFSKKFIQTPINFYSFYGENPQQFDYLTDVPDAEKMRLYKMGTIIHEVAHHIYAYLMGADMRIKWRELVDSTSAITEYATSYDDHKLKYDEYFTEAVRLKTTSLDYFKTNFPEIDTFLTYYFPEIK